MSKDGEYLYEIADDTYKGEYPAVSSYAKGGMLKYAYLSSEQYQKAKKLKDFKKEDYKWIPSKQLYVRKYALNEDTVTGWGEIEDERDVIGMEDYAKGGFTIDKPILEVLVEQKYVGDDTLILKPVEKLLKKHNIKIDENAELPKKGYANVKEKLGGNDTYFYFDLRDFTNANEIIKDFQKLTKKTPRVYLVTKQYDDKVWEKTDYNTYYFAKGGTTNEVYVDFMNKKKGFRPDRKYFKTYEDAEKWARKEFDRFNSDMIGYTEFERPLPDYAKGGTIRKGDYVRDARGELGLVNKVKKGVAYVKYPSTNEHAFEPVFLDIIKRDTSNRNHKGKSVWVDVYEK